MPKPIATWNPTRGLWEDPNGTVDLLSEHSEPFWETWPISGMTRDGRAYELPMPALPMAEPESSSSPDPVLPTPGASWFEPQGPDDPSEWEAWKADRASRGIATGQGTLPTALRNQALLPTPEAKLSDSGPDYARANREGSGGDDLTTTVFRRLLPTPLTSDDKSPWAGEAPEERDRSTQLRSIHYLLPTPTVAVQNPDANWQNRPTGGLTLPSAVQGLLPTPTTLDHVEKRTTHAGGNPTLQGAISGTSERDAARHGLTTATSTGSPPTPSGPPSAAEPSPLLPTPSVADGTGGHLNRSGDRSAELLLPGVAKALGEGALLPTPRAAPGASATETVYLLESDGRSRTPEPVLLPTPAAMNPNDGEDPERWMARRKYHLTRGIHNTMPLGQVAARLAIGDHTELPLNGGSESSDE